MIKRVINIGDYNTADNLWTLTAWELGEPEPVTNFIDVPGRIKGPLDASTVLTDGEVRYGPRPLTITLESSEGTRLEREARISAMINQLHGQRVDRIILPDDPTHYVVGRVSVQRLYNDPAHGSVQVTATCEPWKYSTEETEVVAFPISTVELVNGGLMTVIPTITVEGQDAILELDGRSWALSPGVYQLPDLAIPAGTLVVEVSGDAAFVSFTYREAVLR